MKLLKNAFVSIALFVGLSSGFASEVQISKQTNSAPVAKFNIHTGHLLRGGVGGSAEFFISEHASIGGFFGVSKITVKEKSLLEQHTNLFTEQAEVHYRHMMQGNNRSGMFLKYAAGWVKRQTKSWLGSEEERSDANSFFVQTSDRVYGSVLFGYGLRSTSGLSFDIGVGPGIGYNFVDKKNTGIVAEESAAYSLSQWYKNPGVSFWPAGEMSIGFII